MRGNYLSNNKTVALTKTVLAENPIFDTQVITNGTYEIII
jgi:hypothetical protein